MDKKLPLQVVAVVLENQDRHILLSQRQLDKHLGGLWEFPGGKVETGESLTTALVRECQEELGFTPKNLYPLISIQHQYPELMVHLHIFHCQQNDPQVYSAEQQNLKWVAKSELPKQAMPEADKAIIDAIMLPHQLNIIQLNDSQEPDKALQHILQTASEPLVIDISSLNRRQQESTLDQANLSNTNNYIRCDRNLAQHANNLNFVFSENELQHINGAFKSKWGIYCNTLQSLQQANQTEAQFFIHEPRYLPNGELCLVSLKAFLNASLKPVYVNTSTDNLNDIKRLFGQGICIQQQV